MSLFPGKLTGGGYELANSMALAMEEELEALYKQLKGTSLPALGQEDRRLLFVAIARGILRYIDEHEDAVSTDQQGGENTHTHKVLFNVNMNSHTPHP